MNQIQTTLMGIAMGSVVLLSTACKGNNGTPDNPQNAKEMTLQAAFKPYVEHTVVATYKQMADHAMLLAEACATMQAEHAKGTLTTQHIQRAGEEWIKSRKYWEQSEAFLFGAAAEYNIDPHIDSWPLDKNMLETVLRNIKNGQKWEGNIGQIGQGVLGFHATEYFLFELSSNGEKSLPHSANYSAEELQFLVEVANDLRNQCIRLEAAWAGIEEVTKAKKEILEAEELLPASNFGDFITLAGQPGSKYKSVIAAAEEIIQGCIDIADEVGTQKIGRPATGTDTEDLNYIESPYSLNSIVDFVDNIVSIEHAYAGAQSGDASISDFVKKVDPKLDADVRKLLNESKAAIKAIPEPFAKHAKSPAALNAVKVVGTDLRGILEKVHQAIVEKELN